jgi:hypothetical protein
VNLATELSCCPVVPVWLVFFSAIFPVHSSFLTSWLSNFLVPEHSSVHHRPISDLQYVNQHGLRHVSRCCVLSAINAVTAQHQGYNDATPEFAVTTTVLTSPSLEKWAYFRGYHSNIYHNNNNSIKRPGQVSRADYQSISFRFREELRQHVQ